MYKGLTVKEGMLEKMLDAQPTPIYTFDKDRKILYANKAVKQAQSISEAGKGIGAAESDHFEHNGYFDEQGNKLPYPKGSAVEMALQGVATKDLVIEHRNYQTHTSRWISISCEPVLDENGEFLYGILSHRDITLRKSREHKLEFLLESAKTLSITMDFSKRLEEKAKLTVPNLADWCAIDIIEADGGLKRMALVHRDPKKLEMLKKYQEKYQTKQTGQQTERVARTGVTEFIPIVTDAMIESAPGITKEQIAEIKALSLTSIMIIPIRSKTRVYGTLTLAYAESGRLYTQDDVNFFEEFSSHLSVVLENAILYREISERDIAKDSFLASLSHELRNPLAPIKSSLELIRLKNPPHDLQEDIELIEHQFEHMTRLLSDLLDASRFIHGKIVLDFGEVSIGTLASRVAQSAQALAQKSEITIVVSSDSNVGIVWGDKTRLEQALSNLMHNAIKFTPRGGTITVYVSEESDRVQVTFKDSGIGITEEEMQHIFEPYYQSERVRHGNHGLGIGLRLVQDIARLHDGTIKAQSLGLGLGSEFVLSLPLFQAAVPESTGPVAMVQESTAQKSILIVDDNTAAADSLVKLLTLLGWNAKGVYSAKSALEYLEQGPADIILLDIGMPEMDGYELAQYLRMERACTKPIIALSGYGMEDDKRKAIESGFTMHLTKPVGRQELADALRVVASV